MTRPALIDCWPFLPREFVAQTRRLAAEHGKRVVTKGRGPGSLEPDDTAGLDYIVVTGDAIEQHGKWLWAIYQAPALAQLVGAAVGDRVRPSEDRASCININWLTGPGGRYEKHVDGQPYTLNLFVTPHNAETGGLLDLDGILVDPRPGFGAAFDGSAVPHAVTPLLRGDRLTIPMVFLAEDSPERPAGLSDYLYTEKT